MVERRHLRFLRIVTTFFMFTWWYMIIGKRLYSQDGFLWPWHGKKNCPWLKAIVGFQFHAYFSNPWYEKQRQMPEGIFPVFLHTQTFSKFAFQSFYTFIGTHNKKKFKCCDYLLFGVIQFIHFYPFVASHMFWVPMNA